MRLIDADALKEKLEAWKKEAERRDANINYTFASAIIAQVNVEPTIEERKKGKWNFIGDQMFECTECGTCYTQSQFYQMRVRISDTEFPKFCPNCGADMRESHCDDCRFYDEECVYCPVKQERREE